MITKSWRSILTFTAGCWLMLSPWLLDYYQHDYAAWSAAVVGVVLMLSEMVAYIRPGAWEELLDFILGLCLVATPLLPWFSASKIATINAVAVGILILGLALHALMDDADVQRWWHDHVHHAR